MYFLFNESLITRARNYCVDEFMRSDFKHLMFIDSDIGFDPQDIIAMMALQIQNEEYDIIGGPYPKKCISWEKIKLAVDKGIADENPTVLDKYVGDFVFNPKEGSGTFSIGEPVEVLEIGTGFMLIRKEAMEKFRDTYPEYHYKPDHVRTEQFDGSREILQYFQAEIDPKSKRYLSEDYWFCQKAQEAGLKTWLCPWMKLSHVGTYIFGGSLADLASIGATATADHGQLKKNKKK
jgi:glycosyltransferase involved in cell wall biosynthesis